MQALPLILAVVISVVLAPATLQTLSAGRLARANFRGTTLPCPSGLVVLIAALCALAPLAFAQQLTNSTILRPELGWAALYVVGVAALGLADDAIADDARGWRGHARSLLAGEFSSGALKAVGSAGLALYVMAARGLSFSHFLLGVLVLVLATNVFNLLDLRPGRAVKGFVLLGAALTIGAANVRPLWALGLFVGPVLVVGVYDVRELAMLGDTGSNLVGALAGLWLVMTLSVAGQLVALVALALITAYGEFRSISALIERTPGLRELDSWGRPRDAT